MPKTTGSDQLYQLIHSLTVEENGHFIKFAQRYVSSDNISLQLFRAIRKQKAFEEQTLRKKFKNYTVMKVYLKNMITDSLVQYHRNNNPHIELMALIQKVHVLMMKGMRTEALKQLEKALKQASIMEVFALEQYLLQIQNLEQSKIVTDPVSLQNMHLQYQAHMQLLANKQADILDWEKSLYDVFRLLRKMDIFNPENTSIGSKNIVGKPALSKRADILKLRNLYYAYTVERNDAELFKTAEKIADKDTIFKQQHDSSFNDVGDISNYLQALGYDGKMQLRINEADRFLHQHRADQNQRNLMLIICALHKISSQFLMGKFKDVLAFMLYVEDDFKAATAFTSDGFKQDVFIQWKVLALFLNQNYAQAWREIQYANRKPVKASLISYADMAMMELLTQFMLGNFEMIKSLAKKYRKVFLKHKIESNTYQLLLDFFASASPLTYKNDARKALQKLNDYYKDNNKHPRAAFATLYYNHWLQEIAGGKKIHKAMAEELSGG